MATNKAPIYSKTGQIEWTPALLKTANTATDGTGTVVTIFTAGADGGRVERIRVKHAGTNIATLLRVFINNGGANSTPANNVLYAEKVISANTLSQTAISTLFELPDTTDTTLFPIVLPAGYKLNVVVATTIATGVYVTAIGGNYTA